jgi:hypothetical protein
MSPVDLFAWDCPSCGRQVSRRIATCRCGWAQPDDAAPIETRAGNPGSGSGGTRSSVPLIIGLLLGLGLASMFFWQRSTPATAEQESNPVVAPVVPEASGASAEDPRLEVTAGGRGAEPASSGRISRDPRAAVGSARESLAELRRAGDVTNGGRPAGGPQPAQTGLKDLIAQALPSVVSIQAGQGRAFLSDEIPC